MDRVHAGLTYVDQAGGGDVTESVLRDRRHLADDGLVMIIARVDASDGTTEGEVEIVTRGFGRRPTWSSRRRSAWPWSAASSRRPRSA